jgi:fermentation-respiration switch protein FrsA (DUF1100 family)
MRVPVPRLAFHTFLRSYYPHLVAPPQGGPWPAVLRAHPQTGSGLLQILVAITLEPLHKQTQ